MNIVRYIFIHKSTISRTKNNINWKGNKIPLTILEYKFIHKNKKLCNETKLKIKVQQI